MEAENKHISQEVEDKQNTPHIVQAMESEKNNNNNNKLVERWKPNKKKMSHIGLDNTDNTPVMGWNQRPHITHQSRHRWNKHTSHISQEVEPETTHHTQVKRWNQTAHITHRSGGGTRHHQQTQLRQQHKQQ